MGHMHTAAATAGLEDAPQQHAPPRGGRWKRHSGRIGATAGVKWVADRYSCPGPRLCARGRGVAPAGRRASRWSPASSGDGGVPTRGEGRIVVGGDLRTPVSTHVPVGDPYSSTSEDQRSGTRRASCGRPARSAHGEGSGPEGPNELVQPVVRVVPAVIAAALAQLLRPPPPPPGGRPTCTTPRRTSAARPRLSSPM
jgi:hypothetical protein